MISQDVIGMTIAELTLLLLFVVLILFHIASPNLESKVQEEELASLQKQNVELQNEINEYKEIIQEYKSKITPSCIEKEIIDSPLATILITTKYNYKVGDRTYTYNQLIRFFRKALEEAKENECKQTVRVHFLRGLTANDYNVALLRLRKKFYTDLRGAL